MILSKQHSLMHDFKWSVIIAYQLLHTKRLRKGQKVKPYGNYFLYAPALSGSSVVYSFGIANDLRFDTAVNNKLGVKIYCYDPTPQSVSYMEKFKDDPRFQFTPKGLFDKAGTFRLYQSSNEKKINSSLFDIHGENKFVDVQCDTLQQFMRENGHNHIDVLKMDIEGAAIPVMHQMLDQGIKPGQIAVELEIFRIGSVLPMLWKIAKLVRRYKKSGYAVFHFHALRNGTVELLLVRKDVMQKVA